MTIEHVQYVHYTALGMSSPPPEADFDGFLAMREGFESLPEGDWTEAERTIDSAEQRIARAR